MKRHGYALILLAAICLLLPCQALANSSISLGDLEDIVQAQMLLSQQSGLQEPYSGYYKTYVDYYGGTAFVDSKLTIYVTDTSPAVIQELAKYPGVEIKRVNYSLNQLNQLALQMVELGNAGKINGYGGPPAVLPRHNRVDLTIWTDRDQAQGGCPHRRCWRRWGPPAPCLTSLRWRTIPRTLPGQPSCPIPAFHRKPAARPAGRAWVSWRWRSCLWGWGCTGCIGIEGARGKNRQKQIEKRGFADWDVLIYRKGKRVVPLGK